MPTSPQKQFPPIKDQPDIDKIPITPHLNKTGNIINDLGHFGGLHQPYRMEDTMMLEMSAAKSAVDQQNRLISLVKHIISSFETYFQTKTSWTEMATRSVEEHGDSHGQVFMRQKKQMFKFTV